MHRACYPTPPQELNFLVTAKSQGIEATFKTRFKIQGHNFGGLARLEISEVGYGHKIIEKIAGLLKSILNISQLCAADIGSFKIIKLCSFIIIQLCKRLKPLVIALSLDAGIDAPRFLAAFQPAPSGLSI
jgi:hypothetical protein